MHTAQRQGIKIERAPLTTLKVNNQTTATTATVMDRQKKLLDQHHYDGIVYVEVVMEKKENLAG